METAATDSALPPPSAEESQPVAKANNNENNSTSTNVANQNSNKKDRKPRRQGLPLPDPIPETPVKRYPEPNKTEVQKKIEDEDAQLQACFARLNQTRAFFDQRQKIRDSSKPALDAARKELVQLNDECRTMFDERKSLTARIKELKETGTRGSMSSGPVELAGAGKDGNEALKNIRTLEDLEARITDMQYRLETESMPILVEKRLVSQISFLTHKGRDLIRERDQSIKNEQAEKEARVASRKELEEKRAALDERIDAAKVKLEAKKEEFDEIRAKQEEEVKKLEESTPTIDRDEEKKKLVEIKGNIRKLRDEFQNELDLWHLNERIHIEQQKIAKRKKYEAIQAEREARRKAWEAEQAQYPEPHPYQAEKDMCAGLTVYLQTLLGETVEKPSLNLRGTDGSTTAPSLKSNEATTREITASGKAIGKSAGGIGDGFEDLAFSDFVKKPKSRGDKKKSRRSIAVNNGDASLSSEDSALKPHSIDLLSAFSKLDIKPPNRLSEVRSTLEAVKAKASFYETAPAPSPEEKAEKTKKMEGKEMRLKKNNEKLKGTASNDVDLVNGDADTAFPGLGSESSGARTRSRDSSLPSFKAVASGSVPAPMQMPSSSPTPADTVAADIEMMNVNDEYNKGASGNPTADNAIGENENEETPVTPQAESSTTEA